MNRNAFRSKKVSATVLPILMINAIFELLIFELCEADCEEQKKCF
jgi:hypothetical protein